MRWILAFCLTLMASAAWSQQANPEPKLDPKTGLIYSVPAANAGAQELRPCPEKFDDSIETLKETRPGVLPPKATRTQPVKLTREVRQAAKKEHKGPFTAVSVFTLVVSDAGIPESVCLKTPAGYGLDNEAFKAMERYRFEPATKEGTPFPVRVTMEINFKID